MTPSDKKNIKFPKLDNKKSGLKKPKFSVYWIYAIIAILFIYIFNSNLGQKAKKAIPNTPPKTNPIDSS